MLITRRAAIKGVVATTVGAVTGGCVYGVAYERHQIRTTDASLPVSGLPPALEGLRIGFLTDIHHSAMVPAADVQRAVDLVSAEIDRFITLSATRSPVCATANGPLSAASGVTCSTIVPRAVPLIRPSEIRTMSFTPCRASFFGIGM